MQELAAAVLAVDLGVSDYEPCCRVLLFKLQQSFQGVWSEPAASSRPRDSEWLHTDRLNNSTDSTLNQPLEPTQLVLLGTLPKGVLVPLNLKHWLYTALAGDAANT